MKINMDRVLDFMLELDDATFDYCKSSKKYFKKHGHCVYLDVAKGLTPEERHIDYAYHNEDKCRNIVWSVMEVLNLDTDQRNRLYVATRAMKRWYEKTEWQYCAPSELIDRIAVFVEGKE